MPDKTISQLTAATSLNATDRFGFAQGGASDTVTPAIIRKSSGTLPTIVSVGAEFHSTAVPTATLPGTHTTNDILVLCIQTANDSAYAAPSGYTQLGPQNGLGTSAAVGATKLAIFWKRDGGSEVAPTLTDSGDHTYGVMFAVRGCPTSGDPFRMMGQAWKFTASTTGTAAKGSTSVANALVVNIFAHSIRNTVGVGSGPTNASLTSVTEQFDGSTTDGTTGGGIYIMSGTMATPGDVVASTVTWGSSSADVSTTIAFIPDDAYPMGRGAETQTFIGSSTDLDDTWVKPPACRRIHVQLVDGGGGGSGGRSTGTAEGGGGGGGGGYDEHWYDAEDLGTTVTVHAGKGGAGGAVNGGAGTAGVLSEFDKGNVGPLTSTRRVAGTAAVAAGTADAGDGGCGSGRGTTSPATTATRIDFNAATAGVANCGIGGRGATATVTTIGGSPADWGGGGGESGGDTDASITAANNGWSLRGGGGGGGGRTNTNIGNGAMGGGAAAPAATQGTNGADSSRLPYGGAGGCGGGSSVAAGGAGGFPGGGGGGGGGVASGNGGNGGHGIVKVTTFF